MHQYSCHPLTYLTVTSSIISQRKKLRKCISYSGKYTHLQYKRKHKYLIQILVSGATVSFIYTVPSSTQMMRTVRCSKTPVKHLTKGVITNNTTIQICRPNITSLLLTTGSEFSFFV
jgi:hypothetical protein